MPKVELILQTSQYKQIDEPIEIESSFVPRVGDTINAFDLLKNPDEHGWFFIVEETTFDARDNALIPSVKCVPQQSADRLDILKRHNWTHE